MTSSGSSQTLGRSEARRLVGEIAKDHGYLGEEVFERMDRETRREVEEALLKKDLMIGSSVITLAQNLYTSNARFVFELLQNADDNHYSRVRSRHEAAYVSFHIYSDRIVVENNEDGFERENLKAICNIGKSSKTGAQGYIGEKGIGFKSVFMAAWKAYIQSGNFSFYFQHRKGDSGMGMISPVWQDPEPEQDVNEVFTRITLFLHQAEDRATIATERETIKTQFHELKDTVLLFLKNIDCIKIKDHDQDDSLSFSAATYSIDRIPGEKIVTLEKKIAVNGETKGSKQKYYVFTHIAHNIARSENRTYSAEEDASHAYATAEVILAFPLSNEAIPIPIVKPQEVFAFLPIRDMGFSFLIQSDFVTQANRQDIVTTSLRNLNLLDAIADAFVKAVRQFCEEQHPTLQYQWMRYLLNPEAYFATIFWKKLVLKIKDGLEETPILRRRSGGSLRLIRQLERLPDFALDREGQPLFNDIVPEAYLSDRYQAEHLDILKPYGLTYMDMTGLLKRVKSDLRSPRSKMKSSATDYDWHSRAAKMLMIPFNESLSSCILELKSMDLLPLHDQRWVSINAGSVYYTKSEGIEIPRDLGLDLIDPLVARHEDRRALFDKLHVQEATTTYIRGQIFDKYRRGVRQDNLDLSSSHCHLKYLYLSHTLRGYSISQLANIQIYSQDGTLGKPHSNPFYVSNGERYGAQELLKSTEPGDAPGAGAPGFKVNFIHRDYFNDPPVNPAGHSHQWKEWLHRYVRIQRHLNMTSTNSQTGQTVLSDVCIYLAGHRPEIFLGALKHYWEQEKIKIEEDPLIVDNLRKTTVLCRGDKMMELSSTFLPTLELERRCARFLSDTNFFPFLLLEEPLIEETYPVEWEFLHTSFEVSLHCNLHFYLTVLEAIQDENLPADALDRSSKVYNLYEAIQAQCLESDDREAKKEEVRDFFELDDCILIPASGTTEAEWVPYEDCLWNGPSYMETKYPLQSLYQGCFSRPEIDANTLTQFFRNTLKVPDATWHHLIDEIENLNTSQCTDFDRINDLYTRLHAMKSNITEDDARGLRQAFEDNALIYVVVNGQHSWHRASECLWASATAIRGKTTLNDLYENLKNFFVTFLGVAELDFGMVLDKLIESTGQESAAEIKETLWIFNSLLQRQNPLPPPARILESQIFPVRYPTGQVELRTSKTEFAIVDRQSYGDAFADKAKLLDFSLDEVHRLKPLLRWSGLDCRYLSLLVKEVSQLQGGDPTLISTQDRDLSRRARSLFRIAMHYDSPRASQSDQSIYHLLRNARVYETDGISSQLILSQGGNELSTEVGRSELHFNEAESGLEIYVPRDARSQDFCYRSKLPPQLLEWIMTQPATQIREKIEPSAVLVVNNVINANVATIDWILEAAGIIEVDVPDDDDDNVDDDTSVSETPALHRLRSITPQSSHGRASPPVGVSNPTRDRELFSLQSPSPSLRVSNSHQESASTATQETDRVHSQSRFASSSISREPYLHMIPLHESPYAASTPNGNDITMDEDRNYERLLYKTITAARRAVFPSSGPFNMSAMLNALPDTNISLNDDSVDGFYTIRSASRIERDKKIGAAGELFVFELLSNLIPRLPHFSWDNWQSTIRKYVTVHPEYATMDAWNGRETADIVYDDVEGALTELLISKGHFAEETWRDLKPRYYIEVKSTTGACDVPFYMSKHQYQIMQDLSNRASGSSNGEIYVIFRVFNLYSDSIDVRVYMDPDALRESGRLRFTAESWSVVPTLPFT